MKINYPPDICNAGSPGGSTKPMLKHHVWENASRPHSNNIVCFLCKSRQKAGQIPWRFGKIFPKSSAFSPAELHWGAHISLL